MGYYEEKKKYEQETGNVKTEINKCGSCKKGVLITTVQYRGIFGTVFKSFYPVCGNTIKKKI